MESCPHSFILKKTRCVDVGFKKKKKKLAFNYPGKSVTESKKSSSPVFNMNVRVGSEALHLSNSNINKWRGAFCCEAFFS